MPVGNFSVGRDATLTIVTASGPLNLSLLTEFNSKQMEVVQKIKGLDGVTRFVRFFDGWSGSFRIERQDSTLDTYFAQLEANYYAGLNEQAATITETITESNGAVSQFRYLGVMLTFEDAGSKAGDATIKQAMGFNAQRRVKVA